MTRDARMAMNAAMAAPAVNGTGLAAKLWDLSTEVRAAAWCAAAAPPDDVPGREDVARALVWMAEQMMCAESLAALWAQLRRKPRRKRRPRPQED